MKKSKNPNAVTAVRKYGEQKTKKKKARPIEGRNVQDAYFAKSLNKSGKQPLQIAVDNLLAKLPDQLERNIRNACRLVCPS